MAVVPGLTPPRRPAVIPAVRNTIPRIPQVKPPPAANMGISDVRMGPGTAGGTGYGNVQSTAITPQEAVYALPDVQNAMLAQTQGNTVADAAFNQAFGSTLAAFGDPSVLPGAPAGFSLQTALGLDPDTLGKINALDPNWLQIAQATTAGPGGTIGTSRVAQLYLAAAQARDQAVARAAASGFTSTGQLGLDTQLANMAYGQNLVNAAQQYFTAPIQTAIQNWLATKSDLATKVQQAINTDLYNVNQNPSAYGVNYQVAPVGTVVQRPWAVGQGTNAPKRTNPATFTPVVGVPYPVRGSHGAAP